ncbi:flagellar basal body-associated FliL family protein [Sulfitobacter geojensis]|uniref:flagellar basal body-associated FliL family protein n=1 Tax=Sulfitobacter geojensis TaxID=1342299 RepID=UPI003F5CCB6F
MLPFNCLTSHKASLAHYDAVVGGSIHPINLVIAYRPDAEAGALMEERQPFIRDLFNSYLRGLSEADLRGMGGIMYVKAELLKRARAAVGNDLPQEILIKDLIVQ